MYSNRLLILLAVATTAAARPRIIGGIEVTDRAYFAHQVSIRHDGAHICGGSVVAARHVLTASHCVFYADDTLLDAKRVRIVAGDLNLKQPNEHTIVANVRAIHGHRGYNKRTTENDLAIIELADELPSNDYVRAIALNDVDNGNGTVCVVSGWGFTKERGTISDVLRFVTVPIVDRATCNETYGGLVKAGMICAGVSQGGSDACQYDSGGPLVCGEKLTGIVSWGKGCGRSGFPGIYTDVAHYRTFVASIVDPEEARRSQSDADDEVKDLDQFAYQVSIRYDGRHVCSGSIIDDRHVLTLASCLYANDRRLATSELTVTVGATDLWNESHLKTVENVILHEANSVAVLKIYDSFKFGESIDKIPLAGDRLRSGSVCIASGWNSRDAGGESNILRYNQLRLLDDVECRERLANGAGAQFCAIDLRNEGACKTIDKGSPLRCGNSLVGLQSVDGDFCKVSPGSPGIYTDVTQYASWIEATIASHASKIVFNLTLSLLTRFILIK